MAYQSGFTATIVANGKPIRETSENTERVVRLKFDSEYKIRLKNNNNVRALARVLIDGTEIMTGKLLLQPNHTIDLERFVVDGDLNKGRKLKFVSANHSEVQDPTSRENGLIEVLFEKELVSTLTTVAGTTYSVALEAGAGLGAWTTTATPRSYTSTSVSTGTPSAHSCRAEGIAMDCCMTNSAPTPKDAGATVEGGNSNQQFREENTWFPTSYPVKIAIRMKGLSEKPVFISSTGSRPLCVKINGQELKGVSSYEVTETHVKLILPHELVSLG